MPRATGTDSTLLRMVGPFGQPSLFAELFSREGRNQEKWTIGSRGFPSSATSFMGLSLWLEIQSKVTMVGGMAHEAR